MSSNLSRPNRLIRTAGIALLACWTLGLVIGLALPSPMAGLIVGLSGFGAGVFAYLSFIEWSARLSWKTGPGRLSSGIDLPLAPQGGTAITLHTSEGSPPVAWSTWDVERGATFRMRPVTGFVIAENGQLAYVSDDGNGFDEDSVVDWHRTYALDVDPSVDLPIMLDQLKDSRHGNDDEV